jgi:hypothetical protein
MRRATGNLTFHDRELGMAHHAPFTSTLADNVIICLWHVQAILHSISGCRKEANVQEIEHFIFLSLFYVQRQSLCLVRPDASAPRDKIHTISLCNILSLFKAQQVQLFFSPGLSAIS